MQPVVSKGTSFLSPLLTYSCGFCRVQILQLTSIAAEFCHKGLSSFKESRRLWKSEQNPQIRGHLKSLHLLYTLIALRFPLANNFKDPLFCSFDFAGCFLNGMENVSAAQASDRQTFVFVLFLHRLSLQIWGEVLSGLPLSLSLFCSCIFTPRAQGSTVWSTQHR